LPKQAYLVVEDDKGNIIKKDEYKGTSDITLHIPFYVGIGGGNCNQDDICSSSCTGYDGNEYECTMDEYDNTYESEPAGKIQNGQVSLDLPNIDSKYLRKFDLCDEHDTECNISIIPENLTFFTTKLLYVNVSGNSDCWLVPILTKSGDWYSGSRVYLDYISQSGKDYDYNYDLNFSNGWNIRYRYPVNEGDYYTSDLSKTGGKLEWGISCDY
jgi:hypothetical protein